MLMAMLPKRELRFTSVWRDRAPDKNSTYTLKWSGENESPQNYGHSHNRHENHGGKKDRASDHPGRACRIDG